MEATFKFNEYDRVVTPLGEIGIVGFCGCGHGGNRYSIELAGGKNDWFDECQLELHTGEKSAE